MEQSNRLEAFLMSLLEEERNRQKKRREVMAYLEKVVEEQMELDESEMDTELIDRCVEMILWLAGIKTPKGIKHDIPAKEDRDEIQRAVARDNSDS